MFGELCKGRVMMLDNVLCTRTKAIGNEGVDGALYNKCGELIVSSLRYSKNAAYKHAAPYYIVPPDIEKVLKGKYVYCGHLHLHFGHFLMETLSSLWISEWVSNDVNFVFHPFYEEQGGFESKQYIVDAFELLGIDSQRILIIKENVVIEKIIVPERLVAINEAFNVSANSVYEKMVSRNDVICTVGKKVFLSRSKLMHGRRSYGHERKIDSLFEGLGFSVVSPELISLKEQIALVNNADFVCGFEGSALHLSLFMKRTSKLISITENEHVNIGLCNKISGVRGLNINIKNASPDEHLSIITQEINLIMRGQD